MDTWTTWTKIEDCVHGAEWAIWEVNPYGKKWQIRTSAGRTITNIGDQERSRDNMISACIEAMERNKATQAAALALYLAEKAAKDKLEAQELSNAILSKHPFFGRF